LAGKEWRGEFHNRKKNSELFWENATISPIRNSEGEITQFIAIKEDITQRKETEQILQESEERYRRLVEQSPDAIFVHSDGKLRYVNAAGVKLLGAQSKADLLGRLVIDFVHPDYREMVKERILGIQEGAESMPLLEEKFIRLDGSQVEVEVTGIPLFFEDRKAIQVIARDITARKKADKLQDFTYRVSAANMASASLDELYEAIHSILKEALPAQNFYIALYDETTKMVSFPYFVDEHDSPPAPRKLRKGITEYVLRTKQPLLATPEVYHALEQAGEIELLGTMTINWLGVPLTVEQRTFGVMAVQSYSPSVTFTDDDLSLLTFVSTVVASAIERKRTEVALMESEKRYRELFENATDLIQLLSPDGHLLYVNKAWRETLGFQRGRNSQPDFPRLHPPQ